MFEDIIKPKEKRNLCKCKCDDYEKDPEYILSYCTHYRIKFISNEIVIWCEKC